MAVSMTGRLLCLVICGAGPAKHFMTPIRLALSHDWQIQVIATEAAIPFIDADAIRAETSRPVMSEPHAPGAPRSPRADAVLVAPATFNTINKLALGIADTYALDRLHEAIGLHIPFVLCPFANSGYTERICYKESIDRLTKEGVVVVGDEPHKPGQGSDLHPPWERALQTLERLVNDRQKE